MSNQSRLSDSGNGRPLGLLLMAIAFAAGAACDEAPPAAKNQLFTSGGVRIHYRVHGNGPAVVLIHGLTSTAEDNWRTVVPALSGRFKVITLDVRGHGRSDRPHDPDAYGKKMVNDVLQLMDHLAIDRAHVVGYSMGGFIALQFAVENPHRVQSLIVGGQGWASVDEFEAMSAAAEILRHADSALALVPDPGVVRSDIRDRFMTSLAKNDPKALAALLDNYPQLAVGEDRLRATVMPIMAVIGAQDPRLNRVEKLKSIREDAEVVVIPGETHLSMPFAPGFASAIRHFLESVDSEI